MTTTSDHRKPEATATAAGAIPPMAAQSLVQSWTADHPAFRLLAGLDGVVLNAVEHHQTLVYAGHVARGIYLFLQGELALTAPCGCTEVVDTSGGAFLFPPIGELEEEAGRNAVVRSAGCVVYVPRSWLVTDPGLAASLAEVRVREVSARAQHDQHGSEDPQFLSVGSAATGHLAPPANPVVPASPMSKASAAAPVAASAMPNSGPRLRGRSN